MIYRRAFLSLLVFSACAHRPRATGPGRDIAAVDASRGWSEFGDCVIWPYDFPIMDAAQDGVDVFHALEIASAKDLLTTNPDACVAHLAADGRSRKFKSAFVHPKGRLTAYEAATRGCRVFGGPIVSDAPVGELKPVKRYGDRSNPKFKFLALPSKACDALFTPEPGIAGYVNE